MRPVSARFVVAALLAAAPAALPSAARAQVFGPNLVTNGTFTAPLRPSWTPNGNAVLCPPLGGVCLDTYGSPITPPPAGFPLQIALLSQTVATRAGAEYGLSFTGLSQRRFISRGDDNLFRAFVGGVEVGRVTGLFEPAREFSFTFTAAADNAVLQFRNEMTGPCPPTNCDLYGNLFVLGNVVLREVAVVPEPSTYMLLATGLGVLGLVARRRRTTV
jgi:hypothetical protein